MQDEHSVVCESNDAQVCHSNEKTVRFHTGPSCMLEAWLALTIGLEVSKSIPFRGSYRWLALTMHASSNSGHGPVSRKSR